MIMKPTNHNCDKVDANKPGVAIDAANNEKPTRKHVDEDVKELNNNPNSAPLFNESDSPAPL